MTVLAIITAGMAKMTMNDCTSMDQQNSGMRFSDIPGARILRMVAISSTRHAHGRDLGERDHLRPDIHAFARRELRAGQRRIGEPAGIRSRCS